MLKSLETRFLVLLAIVSVLLGIPITVGASEETGITEDGFGWIYKDGIMAINWYDAPNDRPDRVTIPSEINGKAVTKIDSFGEFVDAPADITIPDSVTEIREAAFADCFFQKRITIPGSVTKIGDYAVGYEYDYDGDWGGELFYLDIPQYTIYGVPGSAAEAYAKINGFLFLDIQKKQELETGTGSETEPSKLKTGKTNDNFAWIEYEDGTMAISYYSRESTTAEIPSVINGKAVTLICVGAFQNCYERLKTVVIPDSVTQIGTDAFEGCVRLANVTIGKSVISIGTNAFKGCNEMKSVLIPDSVTEIGHQAFGYGYDDYEEVDGIIEYAGKYSQYKIPGFTIYGNKGTTAEAYAKENGFTFLTPDKMVVEPVIKAGTTITVSKQKYKVNKDRKSVTYTGPSNKKVSKVTIPDTVTYKGTKYKVTAVNKAAFKKCTKLKTVSIGSNVATIGAAAFQNCTALQTVTIGKNVTTIGKIAFSGCKALKKVTFKGKKIKSIGTKAFLKAGSKNYKKLQVIVPKAKYNAYKKLLLKAKLSKYAKLKKK